MVTKFLTSIKNHLFNSWWVIFFALLCFICYEQGVKLQKTQHAIFLEKLEVLREKKNQELLKKKELTAQINSQTDPARIELILIRELGVVPQGQIKIEFK